MTTSLAEQLQRLAVPQTSVYKQDKKRVSLLFDPKEAAGLRTETIYHIGLEGIGELIQKNVAFEKFQNTIFHFTSKDFVRSVQTLRDNEKLDENISEFLLLLSPYFLLNCSHKALEWLVNRYLIHEYNREDLLMLILPYHESNIFVRVLQLLKFKDTKDNFHFLKPLQNSGVHLIKQCLINHAANNSSFLKLVTKYMNQLIRITKNPHVLTVAFNFYCTVITGALEYSEDVVEDQVSQILPALLKGLHSSIVDYCAASYVITARLVSKTSLSETLLDKLVEKISEVKVAGLKVEAILVLVVLYQSQTHYSKMTAVAVANLSEKDWLPIVLQNLNSSGCYIYTFFELLMKKCAEEGMNNDIILARELINNCLDQVKMDDFFVPTFFHCILDARRPKTKYSEETTDWLIEVVHTLERQYPDTFDKEVCRILSINSNLVDKETNKRKSSLSKVLKNAMTYQGKFDIIEKLYHSNPHLRNSAIKYLSGNYTLLKISDQEMIKNSLIERLYDDNPDIVKETLIVIKKISTLEINKFKNVLLHIAIKCRKYKSRWGMLSDLVVQMLCNNYESNNWDVFLVILPFFLPVSKEELEISKKLSQLPFIAKSNIFNNHLFELKCASSPQSFEKIFLKILKSNSSIDNVISFLQALKQIPNEKFDSYLNYLVLVILSSILPNQTPLEISTLVLEILQTYGDNVNIVYGKQDTINGYIDASISDKFPTKGFLQCLKNIIYKIKKPEWNLDSCDFSLENPKSYLFIYFSNILLNAKECYESLKIFLDYFFIDLPSKIDFLLNLCISESNKLGKHFKNNTLKYLNNILKELPDEEIKQFIYIEKRTTSFFLILLSHPDKNIRLLTFQILDKLISISTRKSNSYFFLLESLQKNKEELILDHEQMPLLMFNILDSSNTKGKKHSSDLNSIRNHLVKVVCAENSPIYLQAGILKLLSHINSFEMLEQVAALALNIIKSNIETIKSFNARVVECAIYRIQSNVLAKVNFDSYTWQLMELCIKNDKIIVHKDTDQICLSSLILCQLDKYIFTVLEKEVITKLLDIIITISSTTQNSEVLTAASRIFKHIDLDANLILHQLTEMRDIQSPKQDITKKKRRVSVVPTVDILDTLEWKKGVSVLEFIQDKKKIRNIDCLLQVLFELLKRCLEFDEQTALEYCKQLLLSSILYCCQKSEDTLSKKLFSVELVVQCIRASQNPQTHHHALLSLAYAAQLIPTQVLHHMMAIFTFMGSSVLRHDDAYSFQIITKIVDTIIPILVQNNESSNIARVLRVFVDAILDVPEHRRMPLYKQLLERISVRENLYIFLLIIFESQVLHSNQEKKKDNLQKRVDIAANLCREFSPNIVIYTTIKLIKYLHSLPDEKEENMPGDGDSGIFNIATHTPKDFRHYKYLLLKFCTNLLGSQDFVNQVAVLSREDELALEDLYKEMIIFILLYIQRISKVTDRSANSPQANYWKVVLHLSYDVLDSVNALVTSQMFLLITKGLMVHKLSTVKRRILELLNSKLQYNSQFFVDCDQNEMYSLIPPLVSIIKVLDTSVEAEQETVIQTSLLSLKLMIKLLANADPEKFVPILEFITRIIKFGKAENNVLASVLLCLAELCVNLKAYAISSLSDFMPAVTKILKQQKYEEKPSVLLLSVITTIEKIFESMPLFMSPYLKKILVEISLLLSRWGFEIKEQSLQSFIGKLNNIKQKLGTIIPPRVFFPAVESAYNVLLHNKCYKAVSAIMDIFSEHLSNLVKQEINSNLSELTSFFLNALKFRENRTLEEANEVENHIVKALTVLILKLSESAFRPLYYKLFDWATQSERKTERLITFYNLSNAISDSLKGLFALFAGHFVSNAATTLDLCNKNKNERLYFEDNNKSVLLLENILKTLNNVFLYDTQKFINKDRFDILMQPLVDQLENVLGDLDDLMKFNHDLLTPCIVNFALATADDSLWKQMNYQILLKMRHNIPQIRLVTLHCLTEIVKKLGEDFLPLLPETVPFLAELLEDEEEEVEKSCQKAVQEIEKVLGEPLQKYF